MIDTWKDCSIKIIEWFLSFQSIFFKYVGVYTEKMVESNYQN